MSADVARDQLLDRLRADGTLRSPEIDRALRTIPRQRFVHDDQRQDAWADRALPVKYDDGVAISSISQPTMIVMMLELAELAPGQRVLEIGTGTGYNAALLAAIVGPEGLVVTVELEADLASAAAARLARLELSNVHVITGDGAAGHAALAPYDRIVVTAGARTVDDRWVAQLRERGRLVVPIVDEDGVGLCRCLVKRDGELETRAEIPCGFLCLRTPGSSPGADRGT